MDPVFACLLEVAGRRYLLHENFLVSLVAIEIVRACEVLVCFLLLHWEKAANQSCKCPILHFSLAKN